MSMSDCPKCWSTPCDCGWDYREWSRSRRIKFAAVVLGIEPKSLAGALGEVIPLVHHMSEKKTRGGGRE